MSLKPIICEEFQKRFNAEANLYASAGRINLIGEHTDYNGLQRRLRISRRNR